MKPPGPFIEELRQSLAAATQAHLDSALHAIVRAKLRGGRVVVITGSGPNIHEGVTTQIAELIHKGLVDGVITSSAVVAHEMAGTLDRVKRVVKVLGMVNSADGFAEQPAVIKDSPT